MTNEERRELEKLLDAEEAKARAVHGSTRYATAMSRGVLHLSERLRATLDRLTDEQSGETETVLRGRIASVVRWAENHAEKSGCDAGYAEGMLHVVGHLREILTSELAALTTEPEDVVPERTEITEDDEVFARAMESVIRQALMAGAPRAIGPQGVLLARIAVHLHRIERALHHSPEPPDSTEPEDDQPLEGRVQEWLYLHVGEDIAPDTARKMLHNTGILPTESETP